MYTFIYVYINEFKNNKEYLASIFIILSNSCLFILFYFWIHYSNLLSHCLYYPEQLTITYLLLEKACFAYHFPIQCFFVVVVHFKFTWIVHFKFSDYLYSVFTSFVSCFQTNYWKFLIISTLAGVEAQFVSTMIVSRSYHPCDNSCKKARLSCSYSERNRGAFFFFVVDQK